MTDDTSTLPIAAISAPHRGNKIEAIKIVHRERGIELKLAIKVSGSIFLLAKITRA